MADGTSVIEGLAPGEDVQRTLAAVQAFGAKVEADGRRTRISGCRWSSPRHPIDCGNSGTATKLLIGAAAGMPGLKVTFIGGQSLCGRPMARLIQPLVRMGADLQHSETWTLPIRVVGRRLASITHRNVPASALVKTALLFAGLGADGITRVIEPIKTRDHGEALLHQFGCGAKISKFEGHYMASVSPEKSPRFTSVQVAGDPSSAAFPLVAALVVPGSSICVENVLVSNERRALFDLLRRMGADLQINSMSEEQATSIASISCRSSQLKGVDVPETTVPAMIDEYPIAAVAAAFAQGPSIFRGLSELRHKGPDRLERLAMGLNACGVSAQIVGNDLIVEGGKVPPGNAVIESRGDHRIAMAFSVLGLGSRDSVTVEGADTIASSFPDYVEVMSGLGARLSLAA